MKRCKWLAQKLRPFQKLLIAVLIMALILASTPKIAYAAGITAVSDTMSRMQKSPVTSTHAIKFTTTNAIQTTGDTITITFPADFNFTGKAIATLTFTHGAATGLETAETINNGAPDAGNWGGVFSGTQNRVLTLTAPTDGIGAAAVAAADKLIISYDATNSVNATVAGNYVVTIAVAGSSSESGSFAIAIMDADQISIAATVDPTITFAMSANSTNFGTVTATAVKTSAPDIILTTSTNAAGGYNITVHDQGSGANPGLFNAVAAYLLGSADAAFDNTADVNVVAGYGVQASSAGATIAADYLQVGTNVGGYKLAAKLLASFAGPIDSQTVTLVHKARALGSSPAGSYADTVTVIATGNF